MAPPINQCTNAFRYVHKHHHTKPGSSEASVQAHDDPIIRAVYLFKIIFWPIFSYFATRKVNGFTTTIPVNGALTSEGRRGRSPSKDLLPKAAPTVLLGGGCERNRAKRSISHVAEDCNDRKVVHRKEAV